MATNYKNILLKDNQGNALLPITLSYYVEYKNGIDVRSYLDTLSGDLNNVNSYIDDINSTLTNQDTRFNTLTNSINEAFAYFSSYVQKPDYASYIVFDNSSYFTELENDYNGGPEGISYVSVQNVIETIGDNVDGLTTRVTTAESDIDSLETRVGTLESDLTDTKSDLEYAYAKVNDLFPEGNLSIGASYVTFEPSGTTTIFSGVTYVDGALDALETKVNALDRTIENAVKGAVNSVASSTPETIRVQGTGDGSEKNGAVSVGLILNSDGKLKSSASGLTVDESKLDADNINITYTYTGDGDVIHNDGKKSVQEFYDETYTSINRISNKVSEIESSYLVSVTGADDSTYARVYTITQGGHKVGTINIPKDQFLKKVEYIKQAPEGAQEGEYPALVFTWNLSDSDDSTDAPSSIVPISSFVDAITSNIVSDITAIKGRVTTLETKVTALETASATHITGVKLDGTAGTVENGVVSLTSPLKYVAGSSTDGISEGFLEMHGIKEEMTNPETPNP